MRLIKYIVAVAVLVIGADEFVSGQTTTSSSNDVGRGVRSRSNSSSSSSSSGTQAPTDRVVPITIRGRHLYNEVTEEVFLVKGVDYQPGGEANAGGKDVLSDGKVCARDLSVFQTLGINCVRIYSINPNENHDECMSMFAASGIYLLLDVNSAQEHRHLNRYEPWTTYTKEYMENVFKVIEAFSNYNNTLGYFIGNEIVNDEESARNSPAYIKAIIRDVKGYMKNHITRQIPLGYSAADNLDYRESLSNFLADGPSEEAVDFYGVNTYQWCGEQTFESSGYDKLVKAYEEYALPVIFSEYGCNEVKPRIFQETETIFSEKMWNVFCGGLAYEYSQEDNDYGLVDIKQDGSIELRGDYERLKQVLSRVESSVKYSKLSEIGTRSNRKMNYQESYENLRISNTPESPVKDLILNGINNSNGGGHYISVDDLPTNCDSEIINSSGNDVSCNIKYTIRFQATTRGRDANNNNRGGDNRTSGGNNNKNSSSSSSNTPGQDNPNGSTSFMYRDDDYLLLFTWEILLGIATVALTTVVAL